MVPPRNGREVPKDAVFLLMSSPLWLLENGQPEKD